MSSAIAFVYIELNPHLVAESFYNGEVENEQREVGLEDFRFNANSDREKCMESIEEKRRLSVYPHPSELCTADCKDRGVCVLHVCLAVHTQRTSASLQLWPITIQILPP